jgi:S-adenosylmethionine:tRNA ribosyltransferase-isomerase
MNREPEPTPRAGRVADFDFDLPEELIAQQPPAERGASRMLVLDRQTGAIADSIFPDLPSLLNPGDLLVLNDSRVIPARLYARRANLRGKQTPSGLIEVLLTEPAAPGGSGAGNWRALVRPGRKVRPGDTLEFYPEHSVPDRFTNGHDFSRAGSANTNEEDLAPGSPLLRAEVLASGEFGERTLRFDPVAASSGGFFSILDQIGHMPLPPYIKRDDARTDRDRYQTVYSSQPGSVAAPTAGLHFTPAILEAIRARGVEVANITLHVGLGTFAPLRVDRLDEIKLHRELYTLPNATAAALNRAKAEGRRIVAVGTTTVRTLEHVALEADGAPLAGHSGATQIFISPGFRFQLVGALLTNFHLPQSSLLMLVSAFAGRERVLDAYRHAVQNKYRFFSYGDCMFLS